MTTTERGQDGELTQQEMLNKFTFAVMQAHLWKHVDSAGALYTTYPQENCDLAIVISPEVRELLFRDMTVSNLNRLLSIVLDDGITTPEGIRKVMEGKEQVSLIKGEL